MKIMDHSFLFTKYTLIELQGDEPWMFPLDLDYIAVLYV